jgi:hypothetical protein
LVLRVLPELVLRVNNRVNPAVRVL